MSRFFLRGAVQRIVWAWVGRTIGSSQLCCSSKIDIDAQVDVRIYEIALDGIEVVRVDDMHCDIVGLLHDLRKCVVERAEV